MFTWVFGSVYIEHRAGMKKIKPPKCALDVMIDHVEYFEAEDKMVVPYTRKDALHAHFLHKVKKLDADTIKKLYALEPTKRTGPKLKKTLFETVRN